MRVVAVLGAALLVVLVGASLAATVSVARTRARRKKRRRFAAAATVRTTVYDSGTPEDGAVTCRGLHTTWLAADGSEVGRTGTSDDIIYLPEAVAAGLSGVEMTCAASGTEGSVRVVATYQDGRRVELLGSENVAAPADGVDATGPGRP